MMEDGSQGEAGDSVPVPVGDLVPLTVVRQQLRYHERDIALTGILHIYNSEELGINEVVHQVLDLPEKKNRPFNYLSLELKRASYRILIFSATVSSGSL